MYHVMTCLLLLFLETPALKMSAIDYPDNYYLRLQLQLLTDDINIFSFKRKL